MLEKDFLYYARVRYNGANGSQSPWSPSFSFKANAIDTPSFLVPNDVTTSNPYFTVGLSPFSGGSLTKAGGVIEAHASPNFDSLLSQSFIGANSDYVEIHLGETNLASYYIRFKYTATNGAESSWSAGKRITYSSVPEGMTINNLNLKISQFTLVDGGQVDFTVVASQSFLLQSVTATVIKPDDNIAIYNFTPSSGNVTSFTGSGNIGYLSNGNYELRVNVKCKDLVTNEIHTFPLKRSEIYPPLSVNNPTVTSSKTSIAQQGEAAYPSGLPPYVAASGPIYGQVCTLVPAQFVYYEDVTETAGGYYSDSRQLNGTYESRNQNFTDQDALAEAVQRWVGIYLNNNNGKIGWYQESSSSLGTVHFADRIAEVKIVNFSTFYTNNGITFEKHTYQVFTKTIRRLRYLVTAVETRNVQSCSTGITGYTNPQQGLPQYSNGLPSYVAPYKYFNLTSSAFSGNWSQTHASTEWQISTNNSFPNFFQTTTVSSGNKLVLRTNNMNSSTTYYVRCRFKSDAGVYSNWSPTVTLS